MWVKSSSINNIFRKFSQMYVVVIGDAIIDTYLHGKVERMSPEARVPVVSVETRESRPGGAGNVTFNVKALGAVPILFSVVGKDEKGQLFRNLLEKEGITSESIFVDPSRPTTEKLRVIGQGKQLLRIDEETTREIDKELEDSIVRKFEETVICKKPDLVIFSDYDKGVITHGLFSRVNKLAGSFGIKVAVDPKKRNFGMYENIHLLKPNFHEFAEGVEIKAEKNNLETIEREVKKLMTDKNIGSVLLTLSEGGVFVHDGKTGQHFPATEDHVSDVTGAGDTVISVAALALAAGAEHTIIAGIANIAGGLVCKEAGVVPVNRERLLSKLLILKDAEEEVNYQFDRYRL